MDDRRIDVCMARWPHRRGCQRLPRRPVQEAQPVHDRTRAEGLLRMSDIPSLLQPLKDRLAAATEAKREALRGTLSNTICNASFYPPPAQPYLLGGDMSVILEKTADAIL